MTLDPNDPPDEELLRAARGGDRDALEKLVAHHQGQVFRFGMKMCRDPEDAKDVLQETMLAMARHVGDFRGDSSLSTWLYTIARSFCLKKQRKQAPDAPRRLDDADVRDDESLVDRAKRPDEALAAREIEHALEHAISELEPMYREVLVLRDVEGLRAAEVAKVLGVSEQAVKSRLHRARLSVRARIAPLLGTSEPPPAPDAASCPDVLTLLSQHLEGEISSDKCAELERHIEACGRCRSACDSLKRTLALCKRSQAEIPEDVQESIRHAVRGWLSSPTA